MATWLQFILCSALILYAGRRVARYGDVIAEKTGLGGLWVGLILLAVATSLPELFTGVGSICFVGDPNLTAGNLFGANTYNLLNIALLDVLTKEGSIFQFIGSGHALTAAWGIVPVVCALAGMVISSLFCDISIAHISVFSILILIVYFICTRIIFLHEQAQQKLKQHILAQPDLFKKYHEISTRQALKQYSIHAAMIVAAGIWLSFIGNDLAVQLGLQSAFIGVLLLGFATTLPELVVSISALRIGAKDMAIANMLGSNLFNITILFADDALYRKGSLFATLSWNHGITCVTVVLMTLVVISALKQKGPTRRLGRISWHSVVLLVLFLLGMYLNFRLTNA